MSWRVLTGDCVEQMGQLEEGSIDAVVCDPPYGIGFMGHEWDQPGEYAAVTANGTPGVFASGKPYPGNHSLGGRDRPPPGQKRDRQPAPSGFTGERKIDSRLVRGAKEIKLGARGTSRDRGGAMEAGRYDLSLTANRRFQAWCEAWATEALRVLKPGGYLLASCGTRTYHRLAAGVEDAGFEIRDSIMWLYGSGFPKSLDVGKAIDKALGAEGSWRREDHPGRTGARPKRDTAGARIGQTMHESDANPEGLRHVYEPETEEAKSWQGWGTALKPGHEPIVVARKPFVGTVAENVLEHGTGGINVEACRVGTDGGRSVHADGGEDARGGNSANAFGDGLNGAAAAPLVPGLGRWPANVVLSEEAAAELDAQSGPLRSSANPASRNGSKFGTIYGEFVGADETPARGTDKGGASRFFYCAKTSQSERDAGLAEGLPRTRNARKRYQQDRADRWRDRARNRHPTVKPIDLMRWLLRMVTPPGGAVLDAFAGSGSTGCAAMLEGFDFVGIDRERGYVVLAEARIRWWEQHRGREAEAVLADTRRSTSVVRRHEDAGQLDLLG